MEQRQQFIIQPIPLLRGRLAGGNDAEGMVQRAEPLVPKRGFARALLQPVIPLLLRAGWKNQERGNR